MIWAECFAKVVNVFELLTIFAECFVHDWWSSKSASTHCNLLVFHGYLLLLLLLYLYVVAISCLFKLITITSVQLLSVVLKLLWWLWGDNLFRYGWPFSCQCFFCVETIQKNCVVNLMTGFYVGLVLAWKRLNTYLYYLVFINMLPFNRRVVIFLLWTGLESNQVLTDVFKNVKM